MQVPLVDLKWQHEQIADELAPALESVISSTAFVLGPPVAEFEAAFAEFQGVAHCVGVGNGTDALELVLRAVGVGEGDEVILPANTFIATALAVARVGATPVLVDADPIHYLIDPEEVESRVGPRTRAILPVHLYGQMAPMERLAPIAERAGVLLLEDAAQAQGARRNGAGAGSVGVAAGVSFYPGKNLGAYGDAGAVLSRDADVADRVRRLRNWGSEQKYHHPDVGFNSRLDTIQAAVLLVKLRHLADWNAARRRAADRYEEMLKSIDRVSLPGTLPGNEHVWHLYVIRVPERDRVLAELNGAGIGAGIHYPVPVHLQGAFAQLGCGPGSFPETEKAAGEILSLPLHPGLTEPQQERVVEVLRAALG
ncbi:MAG: DegT/DnrJ/EryC1/StrS family aminotransferase [Proteobacteria bacterium]|nr:DegT/DnrJ/EryC1/StrS family aminotransferase [Pseudomonadota bacterium]